MVELAFPLSAISEKVQNSKDEIPPSAENDDREKSREKIINIIRDNPTVTQLELSNMLQISTKAIEKHIKTYEKMALYAVWDQTRAVIRRLLMITTSTNGKSKNKINNAQEMNFHTSPPCFLKIWPKYDQIWDIKGKRFCIFAQLELLAKSLWCPEQKRFNYFLLCTIVYNCVFCIYLYIQITQ